MALSIAVDRAVDLAFGVAVDLAVKRDKPATVVEALDELDRGSGPVDWVDLPPQELTDPQPPGRTREDLPGFRAALFVQQHLHRAAETRQERVGRLRPRGSHSRLGWSEGLSAERVLSCRDNATAAFRRDLAIDS